MPNFELNQTDSIAIAAYIWSQAKEEADKWNQAHPLPAGLREGDANEIAGRGGGDRYAKAVWFEGEFSTGQEKDLVPNLKVVASKVSGAQWIYH
jgi:hypothetical protein